MQRGEGDSVRERDGGGGGWGTPFAFLGSWGGGVNPPVTGWGGGLAEAGCGAGITKAAENGFKQYSGDPTRAIGSAWNPFPRLRQGCA